jgi:hypothetical protein
MRLGPAPIAIALVGAAVIGGLALAQPAPPPDAPATPPPPAAEEAPPVTIAPPAPIAAPPIKDEEVAPAAPPKAQVVEKPVEKPMIRARYDLAVLQAIDKVTAETLRFQAAVGQPVRWKGLVFTVRACERSAPDEPIEDAVAYLNIQYQPRPQPGKPTPPPRQAFKGWMFAASPGLNPLQHATYDAWVISCRASRPETPAPPPAVAAPPPKAAEEPGPKAAEPPVVTPPPAAPEVPAVPPPKSEPTA